MPEEDSDMQRASPRHRRDDGLDDAYHEYLWGESSPRSFARKAKVGGTMKRGSRNVIQVRLGTDIDVSGFVSR